MGKQALTLPNGDTIVYQLERRSRRTIGLKITDDGLVVHAPRRIFEFELNRILQEKAQWILNKLEARKQNYVPPMTWQSGEDLLLLGNLIELQISTDTKQKQPHFSNNVLTITALQASNHADFQASLQRKVIQWYKKQAEPDFIRRLEIFAAKLGVPTPPLALSNAQARWGSCSSRGEVRLNWRLLQAPPHIINYVVCHELAHLKEMNHSARFWAIVESIFPDYKRAEKELKALSPHLHRL